MPFLVCLESEQPFDAMMANRALLVSETARLLGCTGAAQTLELEEVISRLCDDQGVNTPDGVMTVHDEPPGSYLELWLSSSEVPAGLLARLDQDAADIAI